MNKQDNIAIILQARMGSTRLPGKVLLPFGSFTLLGWILQRLEALPWSVIVATSKDDRDLLIHQYCETRQVECFRGSEEDVLDRFYACAELHKLDHVIRLTADNPFTDIEALQGLVTFHMQGGYDYSHNFTYLPVGAGAEIFTAASLLTSWQEGVKEHHREHVNEYILENSQLFKTGQPEIPACKQHRELLLTIDTSSDYQRISRYLDILDTNDYITTEQLIKKCLYSV